MKKLDRVLINQTWLDKFPTAFADFLPLCISDHSPTLLNITSTTSRRGNPFRFYNYWSSLDKFSKHVGEAGSTLIEGNF